MAEGCPRTTRVPRRTGRFPVDVVSEVQDGVEAGDVLSRAKDAGRAAGIAINGDDNEGTFRGTAEGTCEDQVFMLGEDESTYIPLGHKHRLANPGRIPLELIEVQSGAYLGEDDIVRFEDIYGRSQ